MLLGVTFGLAAILSILLIVVAIGGLRGMHKNDLSIWDYVLNCCVMLAGMIGVVTALYVIAFFLKCR